MAMDSGLGQQTYGHPHQLSGGWMPSHMAAMEQSGNMMAPSHTHGMYSVNHQPLAQMYYELDNTISISSASTSHHIGDHQPSLASQPHNQLSLATTQANLPAKLASGAETNRSKQSSPTPTGSPSSLDAADSSNPKSHSTPMTLKWLNDNYEVAEGVCIPRSTLYQHYIEFCEGRELNPVNAASFGKIIRQQFPQITTRRLGTRGQSKYHYYGIGVKEQSPYYDYVYSKAGLQSVNTAKKEAPKQAPIQAYSPRSKMGTLLPEFPDVDELKLPEDIEPEKLLTFIMMYRTHCQRILDTVIRANFDEVQNFLLHFWQGMPAHMTAILGVAPVVGMVAVCDTILYKAVCNVLMPHVLQPLPESLTMVIKKFAKQLEDWISEALSNLPQSLKDMKLKMARKFSRILRLQMSLNHLCQASRSVVSSSDIMSQMLDDWQAIDRGVIIKQTQLTLCQKEMIAELSKINQFYDEFEILLQDQGSIESFIEWLDKIIEESIIKASDNATGSVKRKSQSFLLVWSAFSTKIIRDMTLHSAPSFGSFHLLHLMFDDYILYHLEHMCCSELSDEILADIRGTPKVSSIRDTILQSTKSVERIDLPGQVSQECSVESGDITSDAVRVQLPQPGAFVTSSHVELLSQLTESVNTANGERAAGDSTSKCSSTSTTPARSSSVAVPSANASMDARLLRARAPNSQAGNLPYYVPGLDNVDQTWRLADAAQQSNINYAGGDNFNVSTETSGDILYYAVNSMNLPPESTAAQTESASPAMTSRVTFDPADAQEALNRSFQPFTQHMYPGSGKSGKRRGVEPPVALPTKRYHGEGDGDPEFEANAGEYVHT